MVEFTEILKNMLLCLLMLCFTRIKVANKSLIYPFFCGRSHSTDVGTYIHMSNHPYGYTHVHLIPMSTFERFGRSNLEIHKVGQRAHRDRWRRHLSLKE
jgi:hypothetical protein